MQNDKTTQLGDIALKFLGCDSPGVNCDSVQEISEPKNLDADYGVSGYMSLGIRCGADIGDRNKVYCQQSADADGLARIDVQFLKEKDEVYLLAVNGAAISNPSPKQAHCSYAIYAEARLRITDFGPEIDPSSAAKVAGCPTSIL